MIRRIDLLMAAALFVAGCAEQHPAAQQQPTARQQQPAVPMRPQFLSPSGGEIWREGESYVIAWQAPGWDSVNVGVVMGGKDRGHLAFGRDAKNDTLIWPIPVGWVTGFGIMRSDHVRLRLEDASDPGRFLDSKPFTVTGEHRM